MKKQLVRMITVAAMVAALGAPSATAQATEAEQRGQLTAKDYKFLAEATQVGMMEVEMGELAKQKGASPTVRDFGQRLVTDHEKANLELKQLAASKQAVQPSVISQEQRSHLDSLEKLNGGEFNKAFAAHAVKHHKKSVKDFEAAAQELTDPELRRYAEKTLQTLREHLLMAQEMEKQIKK